jgi:hypothetical protein
MALRQRSANLLASQMWGMTGHGGPHLERRSTTEKGVSTGYPQSMPVIHRFRGSYPQVGRKKKPNCPQVGGSNSAEDRAEGRLLSLEVVEAFADGQDVAAQAVILFDLLTDFLIPVKDGGVIPSQSLADLGQRCLGLFAGQKHRHLS